MKNYQKINSVYGFVVFTAKNSAPNRDGVTGEIRMDRDSRVYMSNESMNQIIRYGVDVNNKSYGISNEKLLLCKMGNNGVESRVSAMKRIIAELGDNYSTEGIFMNMFDTVLFGDVCSEEKKVKSIFPTTSGNACFVFEPITVSRPTINISNKSNSFAGDGKEQSGSRTVQVMEDGTFVGLFRINLNSIREKAKTIYGITNDELINDRINELVDTYLNGLITGLIQLRGFSVLRRGIEPVSLYTVDVECEPTERISNFMDVFDKNLDFESNETDINNIKSVLPEYFNKFNGKWNKFFGEDLI